MMENAIKYENVDKSYGKKRALNGLSFCVKRGETAALLGANGAGKTTALECLEGIRRADTGNIQLFGMDAHAAEVKKRLGVQLQSTSLPEAMTPPEAMKLFCAWRGTPYRADLLTRFGLDDYAKKTYSALSEGRKRRLHLALALCHDPEVLILDEPTAGLDVEGRHALHAEIRALKKRGVTILMATHDMEEAESLCDSIVFLKEGRVEQTGSPLELTARVSALSRILLKTSREIKLPEGVKYELLDGGYISFRTGDVKTALRIIMGATEPAGVEIVDLRVERASLEELFINIANGEDAK